jgi:hypothetical protein
MLRAHVGEEPMDGLREDVVPDACLDVQGHNKDTVLV